jgi:hypothetical protein
VSDVDLDKLNRRLRLVERREGLLYAEFLQTAASVNDVLTVRVPSYDEGEHSHGDPDGVVWAPRVDDAGEPVYPAEGDPAYVMEANDGRWVVIAWTPA